MHSEPEGVKSVKNPILYFLLVTFGQAIAGSSVADEWREKTSFRECSVCPEMVVLPALSIVDGSTVQGTAPDSSDSASNLAAGRFEISIGEWNACVQDGGCERLRNNEPANGVRHPVSDVSWFQANDYTRWLSNKTGNAYRLPTGQEWEFLARGGQLTDYPWGDLPEDRACEFANYDDVSYVSRISGKERARRYRICDDGAIFTAPVGRLKPNGFGLYDTGGNVWEWTLSCWNGALSVSALEDIDEFVAACEKVEMRGGSYRTASPTLSVSRSAGRRQNFSEIDIGFRVVRELNER